MDRLNQIINAHLKTAIEEDTEHYDKIVEDIESSLNAFSDFLRDRVLQAKFQNAFLNSEGKNIVYQSPLGKGFLDRLRKITKELEDLKNKEIPKIITSLQEEK